MWEVTRGRGRVEIKAHTPGVSPKVLPWAPWKTVTSDWELPELTVMPRAVPAPPRFPLAEVILQWAAARGRRPRVKSANEGYMICTGERVLG